MFIYLLKGLNLMDFKVEISKIISLSIDMDTEEIYNIMEIPPNDQIKVCINPLL